MRAPKALIGTTALALVLGLSACGDDADATPEASGTSAPTSASTSGAPQLTGAPIVVGTIGSYSGPQSASLGAVDETMQAWAKAVNAANGINGHPVKLVVEDDQGNPTKAQQLVRKMVEQDKVVAFVGNNSTVTEAFQKYIAEKKVPFIGSAEYQLDYLTNPYFFPTGAQAPFLDYGLLVEAKKVGVTKLGALPCAEVAACSLGVELFRGLGQIVGMELAYTQKITVSQPNYNAECLGAKGKGVDGLAVVQNAATVLSVADQCAKQGFKPRHLNVSATTGQIWQDQPNLEGMITVQSNPVLADTSLPSLQAFHTALDTYAPEVAKGDQYNEIDLSSWAGGMAFKLAAERAKLTPTSTSADLLAGLYTFKGETVDGLAPPLTYAAGQPSFVTCWFPQQIKDGKFVPLTQNATPSCVSPADLPKLQTLLSALAG
jgi:branched-chain amino acid transport system substrate-binding protein